MRRLGVAIFAALVLVGAIAPAALAASPSTANTTTSVPKVVFIVGPAGAATDGYRAQARMAAAIARQYTPDVVELYSPDATWPAVKAATQGASLVVYMGHGNGWPSRYRDSLFPPSQDGFGLNPAPGGDDSTHQYFGEGFVGTELKLAKNAVVLLNHLCYASGNSEPGLPEGTLDVAEQRVDNYAAGFIKAGAAAVIAEAWSSPNYFVRAILSGSSSIQSAWLHSPSANGHRIAFASQRSRGYVAQMDPETPTSGFTRSIVMKSGLAPRDVLAGAAGSAAAAGLGESASLLPPEPTLIGTGLVLSAPTLAAVPTAGSKTTIQLPFTIKDPKQLPKKLEASVRWDPIEVAVIPSDAANEVAGANADPATASATAAPAATSPAASTAPSASTAPTATAAPSATTPSASNAPVASAEPDAAPAPPGVGATAGDPGGDTTPAATAAPASGTVSAPRGKLWIDAPADVNDLVVPEQLGDVVAPTAAKIDKKSIDVSVTLPTTPGRYRLTVTLHDGDGVAYDAMTQAMLPVQIVRITGDFDGSISVVPAATLTASVEAALGVRVKNLGKAAWGHAAIKTPSGQVPAAAATVVARWVPLSSGAALDADPSSQYASADLPIGLAPGKSSDAWLYLSTPDTAGDYLLVLDVIDPEAGSLVASGAQPTLVRVSVTPAP